MLAIELYYEASKGVLVMEQNKFEGEDNGELKGMYTDCFRVGHSAYKFVIDFGQLSTDETKTRFHTRIMTGPDTAKAFVQELRESVKEYEEQFGQIPRND